MNNDILTIMWKEGKGLLRYGDNRWKGIAILVTPICPFMLESRPVLLPSTCTLTTRLVDKGNMKVIVDGRFAWDMRADEWLEVEASDKPLRLISSPNKGYFEILRSKLNWGGRFSESSSNES